MSAPLALLTPDTALGAQQQAVLEFWFADGLLNDWPTENMNATWFGGGKALDQQIDQKFGALVRQAVSGELADWEAPLLSRLALVVLLDQFSRNVFRGSARAFSGDARAQQIVRHTLDCGEDRLLPVAGRVFLYMPLMHAESIVLQNECVACFTQLQSEAPDRLKPLLQDQIDFAAKHRDIVAAYGRFPYRNAVLDRVSTVDEVTFLRDGPRFGQ